jgi:hypothetical protein
MDLAESCLAQGYLPAVNVTSCFLVGRRIASCTLYGKDPTVFPTAELVCDEEFSELRYQPGLPLVLPNLLHFPTLSEYPTYGACRLPVDASHTPVDWAMEERFGPAARKHHCY